MCKVVAGFFHSTIVQELHLDLTSILRSVILLLSILENINYKKKQYKSITHACSHYSVIHYYQYAPCQGFCGETNSRSLLEFKIESKIIVYVQYKMSGSRMHNEKNLNPLN